MRAATRARLPSGYCTIVEAILIAAATCGAAAAEAAAAAGQIEDTGSAEMAAEDGVEASRAVDGLGPIESATAGGVQVGLSLGDEFELLRDRSGYSPFVFEWLARASAGIGGWLDESLEEETVWRRWQPFGPDRASKTLQ